MAIKVNPPPTEFPLTWEDLKFNGAYLIQSGGILVVHAAGHQSPEAIRTTQVTEDGLVVPCVFDRSTNHVRFRPVDLEINVRSVGS
jgi:hypothetical protein